MRLRFLNVDYYEEKPKQVWEEQDKLLPPISKDDLTAAMVLSPLHFSAINARAGLFEGRNVHLKALRPEKRSPFLSSSTCLPAETFLSDVPSREESLGDKKSDVLWCARSELRDVCPGHFDSVEASIDKTRSVNIEKEGSVDFARRHWSPLSSCLEGDGWQELEVNGYHAAPDGLPRTMKTSDLKVSFGMLENVAPSAVLSTSFKNHYAAASQPPAVASGAACYSQTYDGGDFLVSESILGQVDVNSLSGPKLSDLNNSGKIMLERDLHAVHNKTYEESVQMQLAVDEPLSLLSDWLQENDSSEDLRVHGRLLGSTADETTAPDLEGSEFDVASVTGVQQSKPQRGEECAPKTSDGTFNNDMALAFVGPPVVGSLGDTEINETPSSCLTYVDQMKVCCNVRKTQDACVQDTSSDTDVEVEDAVLSKEVADLSCRNHVIIELSEKDVHTDHVKVLKNRNVVPVATCLSNSMDFADDLNCMIRRQNTDGLAPAQGNEPDVAIALAIPDDLGGGESTSSNLNTASDDLASDSARFCPGGPEPEYDEHCTLNNSVEVQQPLGSSLLVAHCAGVDSIPSVDQCSVPGIIYLNEDVENTQVKINRNCSDGISRKPDDRKIQCIEGDTRVVANLSGSKTPRAPSDLDMVKNHTTGIITNSEDGVHCKRAKISPEFILEQEATMVSPGTSESLQRTCMSQELAFFVEARRGSLGTSSGSAQHHKLQDHTCNMMASDTNFNYKRTGSWSQVHCSSPEIPNIEGSYHEHEVKVPSPIMSIVCCLQSEYIKILEANDKILRKSNSGCRVPTKLTGDPNLLSALLCDVKEATSRRDPPQVLRALLCLLVLQQTSRILCSQGARVAYHYLESIVRSTNCARLSFLDPWVLEPRKMLQQTSHKVELGQSEEHPKLIILKKILQGTFGVDLKSNPNRPKPKGLILAERRVFFTLHNGLHSLGLKALEVDTGEALLQHGDLIQDKIGHLHLEIQQALSSFDCVLLPYTYLNAHFPLVIFSVIIQYDEIPFSLDTRSEVGRLLSRAQCCRHVLKVAQVHPAKEAFNKNTSQQTRQPSTSRTCSTTTTERPLCDPHGTCHLETLSRCQDGQILESNGTKISPTAAAQSQNHHARSLAARMKSSQSTVQRTTKCIYNPHTWVFRDCEMILVVNSGRTSDRRIRSLCQGIIIREDENLQVVEREMTVPVDLILSAATCLTVYTPERLNDHIRWGTIRPGPEAILCENMKAMSLCFHVSVMIFQGPTSFTAAALQLSDNLYSSAVALGIKVQCFVSNSENSTSNIIKGCVEAVRRTRKLELYSVMPDTPTVEENVLTKFPCINHLSAHAILSCGVSLTRFLSLSYEQQVEATQAFDVPPNSLLLFKGQYQSRNHMINDRSATIPTGITTAPEHESSRRNYDRGFKEQYVRSSGDIQAAHLDELHTENQGIRVRLPPMQTLYGASSPRSCLSGIKGQAVGTTYQSGATIETHSMARKYDADIEPSSHDYAEFKRCYGLASDDVVSQLTSEHLAAEDHDSSFPFFPPACIINGEMNTQIEEDEERVAPALCQYEDQATTASAHLRQQPCVATFSMPTSNSIQDPQSAIDDWIRADKMERIPLTCSARAAPSRKKKGYIAPQNSSTPSQTTYKPRPVSHNLSPGITPSKVRAVVNPSGLDLFRHDTREAHLLAPKMFRQTKLPFAQFSPSPHKRGVQSASPMRSWRPMDKRAKEVLTYHKMGQESQSHLIWEEQAGSGTPKRTMVGSVSRRFY